MHTLDSSAGGATVLRGVPGAGAGADEPHEGRAWLDEPEIPKLGLRTGLSVALTTVLLALAAAMGPERNVWLELALASPVVLWAGLPFYGRAVASIRRRRPGMFALLSLGTLTAFTYSLVRALLATDARLRPHLYFEAAAFTVTLVLVGETIERLARRRAMAQIDDDGLARRTLAPRATRMERVADRVSAALVPAVLTVAALAFVGWYAFGPEPRLFHAIASAVAVLVIAAPAAIGLATPLPFLAATAEAKRSSIRVHDAETLETLANVTTLVVDRTGVLTEGRPRVQSVEPAPGFDREQIVRFAAIAEDRFEHPLARAVVTHALVENAIGLDEDASPHSVRRPIRGRGVEADVSGRPVLLGTHTLLEARGVSVPADALARAEYLRREGATVSFAAIDGAYAGLVALEDGAREEARAAIGELRCMGVRIVMMTGAARTSGLSTAHALDMHEAEVFAQVHPDDRAKVVAKLVSQGEVVAVAAFGDRHVDAMSAAHVGITLGGHAHTDVALADGDLNGLVHTVRIARRTARTVRQNLALAFGYNIVAVPIAAGVCYLFAGTSLNPLLAATAMGLGTLSVIANSLRTARAR